MHSPSLQKHIFVQDLQPGAEINELFLIGAAQQQQAKNGPYWRLEFRDNTGSINGKIWSPQSAQYPDLAAGVIVQVKGRIISYRDIPEISIDTLQLLNEKEQMQLDIGLFLRSSARPPLELLEELTALCQKNMIHKPWKKFTTLVLQDETIRNGLLIAPAAKGMHHAYAGGLVEHTLSVCHVCLLLAQHYPHIDQQTLLAGALCHDLGKIWELSSGLTIEYTQPGRLLGHIFISLEYLTPLMHKAGLTPELAEHLKHLILSHHGKLEFGSPRLPATAEALVLHYADDLDAKLQQVETALADIPPAESGWSNYCAPLERTLFKAQHTPESKPPAGARPQGATKIPQKEPLPLVSQCSLLSKE